MIQWRNLTDVFRCVKQWMRTIEGVAILARRSGEELPELDEVAFAAIILAAEAYVHDYARRGHVASVQEKTPAVVALARVLFEHGVAVPGPVAPRRLRAF